MADNRQKLIHLHTDVVKIPSSEVLNLGEIAVQHADAEAALYIKKNNGDVTKFIDVTAIDAKVEVEKLRAEGAEEALEAKITTLEGSNHSHTNKDVLDGISEEKVAAWDGAEAAAIAKAGELADAAKDAAIEDAVEKYQPKGDYEVAGAADAALEAAKADAAEKYQVKGEYEAAGAADAALEAAKAYADGLASGYENAGAAATAEQNAKDYADSLAGNYDAAGSAAQSLTDAKSYVDEKILNIDCGTY